MLSFPGGPRSLTDPVHSPAASQGGGAGQNCLCCLGPPLHLVLSSEVQRGGVDAVAESCWLWSVLKDVTEVAPAVLAGNFCPDETWVGYDS